MREISRKSTLESFGYKEDTNGETPAQTWNQISKFMCGEQYPFEKSNLTYYNSYNRT